MNILDNYIYLYHTDEFLILPTYPDQIMDSMQSTFASTNALSRSAPIFSFSNAGPRTVQIGLELHRDMLNDLNSGMSTLDIQDLNDDYVDTLVKRLQAIALPKYLAETKAVEPPMVAVRFGDEIFIKGVVIGGISITYKKPIIIVNGRESKYAQVSISFNVHEVDPYDAESVARLGSFRGLTKSNNIFERGR